MRIPAYAKTIVALVFAALGVIVPVLGHTDYLDVTDVVEMVLGVLAAFGVYAIPNSPAKDPANPGVRVVTAPGE